MGQNVAGGGAQKDGRSVAVNQGGKLGRRRRASVAQGVQNGGLTRQPVPDQIANPLCRIFDRITVTGQKPAPRTPCKAV